MTSTGRGIGILAITFTSLLWGTTGTAATFASEVSPLAIGSAALGFGGLLQALIALPSIGRARPRLRLRPGLVVAGGLSVAVYPLAFYSSMYLAGVAIGSVVSLASAPLAAGLFERFIDRVELSRWWLSAAGLGVVGSVALCVAKLDSEPGELSSTLAGIALGLVAGASYAVYSWAARRLIAGGVPRAASMGAVFGLGGLLLMPVLLLTGAPLLASASNTLVAVYMALVPMFLGYLAFGFGLTRVSAGTATTITLTEPAIATVLAVLVVGERLSAVGWTGLAVIGAAILVLAFAPTDRGDAGEQVDERSEGKKRLGVPT